MEPPGLTDTLLMPTLFGLMALFGFGLVLQKQRETGVRPKFRYVVYALILLSFFFGASKLWQMINPTTGAFYVASLPRRAVYYAHWLGFAGPLILVLAVVAYEVVSKRQQVD